MRIDGTSSHKQEGGYQSRATWSAPERDDISLSTTQHLASITPHVPVDSGQGTDQRGVLPPLPPACRARCARQ